MSGVIFGRPYAPAPPPPPSVWTGMSIRWTGWDGSEWDLTSAQQGVALQGGFRGFNMPEIKHYRQQGPSTDGSLWNGFRVEQREMFLPLLVYVDSSDPGGSLSWMQRDASFFDTLRPGMEGTFTVVRPDGQRRTCTARFESDNGHAFENDPSYVGWAPYGLTLVAADPFWYGDTIHAQWGSSVPQDFLSQAGGSTLFYISEGQTFGKAAITNTGQHDSYIKWTIKGAFDGTVNVGIGSRVITIPFPIAASDTVTIDTSPRDMRVMVNGVDKTKQLTSMPQFTPVPPGGKTNLSISYTGVATGTVAADLETRYYRAW